MQVLSRPDGAALDDAPPMTNLSPLAISGVVVRKSALVAALRGYLPNLRDLQVTEDGECFSLMVEGVTTDETAIA